MLPQISLFNNNFIAWANSLVAALESKFSSLAVQQGAQPVAVLGLDSAEDGLSLMALTGECQFPDTKALTAFGTTALDVRKVATWNRGQVSFLNVAGVQTGSTSYSVEVFVYDAAGTARTLCKEYFSGANFVLSRTLPISCPMKWKAASGWGGVIITDISGGSSALAGSAVLLGRGWKE